MKLSSKLPKDNMNGLSEIAPALQQDPRATHVALVVLNAQKFVEDVDTGEVEPTMRILRIERILPQDASTAETMIRRALEARTGQTTLPLDVEDEITRIFKDASIDPTTGQTHDGEES